jgi:hypothetical protein
VTHGNAPLSVEGRRPKPSTAASKHSAETPSDSATSPTTESAHCSTAAHSTHTSTHSELRRAGLPRWWGTPGQAPEGFVVIIGELTPVGCTVLTRIRPGASAFAHDRIRPKTPCLEAM